ncbi:MAG: type VI secretion system baseplate subunit TssE [Phycisphaerales bacterium]
MSSRRDGADLYFPSLLDRLREDDGRTADWPQFKALVLRDLAALLNARCPLDDLDEDDSTLESVRTSVVNFGLPDTTGRTLTPQQVQRFAKAIERAIRRYEPRLELDRRNAVRIVPSTEKRDEGTLKLEIRGELKSEPAPEWLCIATELNIETGDCIVTEAKGAPDE